MCLVVLLFEPGILDHLNQRYQRRGKDGWDASRDRHRAHNRCSAWGENTRKPRSSRFMGLKGKKSLMVMLRRRGAITL